MTAQPNLLAMTAPDDAGDSVSSPRHPFGLPLGTVRGLMSLLICGFFWVVLLWPDPQPVRPLLAHFFMLALVLLAFSPYSKAGSRPDFDGDRLLPKLLRFGFVVGTLAVIGYVAVQHPDRLKDRLTPDIGEFKDWWGTYLAVTFGGFAAGIFVRFLFGRENPVFQTLRAWLSVVGLLMMVAEVAFWVVIANAENKPDDFLRFWQAFELAFVAAYFGTRS